MIFKLRTEQLQEFAGELNTLRKELYPNDPDCNGGFYLIRPNELYIDESIDYEIIDELDKLVCLFEGNHRVLERWELAQHLYNVWGVRLDEK